MGTLSPMILNQPDIAVRQPATEAIFFILFYYTALCTEAKGRRMAPGSVDARHQSIAQIFAHLSIDLNFHCRR
jgi:hypothetical protein